MIAQKNAPGSVGADVQAQRGAELTGRDSRITPPDTQAEESNDGFLALFRRYELSAPTVARLNQLGREIAGNVARGKCVLCGGRGGDTINPGDPCPLCGKERGQ